MDASQLKALLDQGLRHHHAGRLPEALDCYARYTQHDLTQPDVLNNMGVALRALGHHHAAVASYERALALNPGAPGTWTNMGNALRELGLFERALAAHARAGELGDLNPTLLHNIGIVYRDMGDMERAIAHFDRGLAMDPDHTNCRWDRALALLMLGRYTEGLREYEWRWKTDKAKSRRLTDRAWNGAPLDGKTLLLTTEQGFGDAIQWMRFIPQAAARGARIIVESQPELRRLLEHVEGVAGFMEAGTPPVPHDVQLPLLSLSGTLGTTLETLPRQVPYITIPRDPAYALPPVGGTTRRIGINWAGKLKPRDRSCPLTALAPLFGRADVAFYSLQMGGRADDVHKLGFSGLVTDLGRHIRDFHDMAQFMMQMDLVITIDSAPAHLAGALGVPTWTMLLYAADWRWMLERSDSPWYPTMRLFRQTAWEDWSTPTAQVREAFTAYMNGEPPV
ncbi:tetratricopeptide repeat-containing glycosyltransferase family protein [Azospirillum sp.]|uniref:tetratricopeptide repeat protein n=1 Tax=Azospirillum sp. TaxID=34012 RepID=UPI002D65D1C2|nr:tetratricopeptide repeat-containing glycosyltransferase family protein [Azospirillum sp.]HYD64558.1 tetratricopeptide repeat-containing glycosyltransferase family protein [Azospirillum sp.]